MSQLVSTIDIRPHLTDALTIVRSKRMDMLYCMGKSHKIAMVTPLKQLPTIYFSLEKLA